MPSDVRTLVNGFAKNPLKTRREGLYFKEKDYKCIRADDYSLYAKNVSVQDVKTTGKNFWVWLQVFYASPDPLFKTD